MILSKKCSIQAVFGLLALASVSCSQSKEERFTLYQDEVKRVEACHLVMSAAPGKGKVPFAAMEFACNVPESALKEEKWWGDQPQPLGFTAAVGDCLLLGETFYCVEDARLGEATFKATYKWATRHHNHLEVIR
jgi:hypothetical protein